MSRLLATSGQSCCPERQLEPGEVREVEMLDLTVFLVFGREGQAFNGQHSVDSGFHVASKSLYGTLTAKDALARCPG